MSFWHNMNHRPHHNLTQMSHWIKTDNRNRNSTKHCCYQVLWKDKFFWIHFKTEFSTLPSEDLFSTLHHSPTRKDSISSRANALATRTSSLVWHSRVTLSRVELRSFSLTWPITWLPLLRRLYTSLYFS